jgi:hypothetical protein
MKNCLKKCPIYPKKTRNFRAQKIRHKTIGFKLGHFRHAKKLAQPEAIRLNCKSLIYG